MSIAAYNRGSALIRKQLDEQTKPVEFEIIERLNAIEKYPDAGTPFGNVRIRFYPKGAEVYCPTSGYGYWYKTVKEIMRRWNIVITGYDGEYIAEPLPEKPIKFDDWYNLVFLRRKS